MYYLCKFSETWSIYDATKNNSRNLEVSEITCLKTLFPGLLQENKILLAIQVTNINPNKLLQLSGTLHSKQDSKSTLSIKKETTT